MSNETISEFSDIPSENCFKSLRDMDVARKLIIDNEIFRYSTFFSASAPAPCIRLRWSPSGDEKSKCVRVILWSRPSPRRAAPLDEMLLFYRVRETRVVLVRSISLKYYAPKSPMMFLERFKMKK